jgi:hypothetical protein
MPTTTGRETEGGDRMRIWAVDDATYERSGGMAWCASLLKALMRGARTAVKEQEVLPLKGVACADA